MRIISTSDLQLDKEGSKRRIAKIKPMLNLEADVLIYLGDLSDNKTNFQKGLEILAKTKATSRFYVIGNRDLLSLEDSALTDHCDEIQERLLPFGFHLLDKKPKIVNGVGFVGNCAWYDGSLFKVPINPFSNESYPDNLVEALRYVETHFLSAGYNIPAKLSSEDFFIHCYNLLESQLEKMTIDSRAQKIVLATHHVPLSKFVKYGKSQEYDFWNVFMGSDSFSRFFTQPKVALGLTAQTRRTENHLIGKTRVYNVGCTNEKPYHVFDDKERYVFNLVDM